MDYRSYEPLGDSVQLRDYFRALRVPCGKEVDGARRWRPVWLSGATANRYRIDFEGNRFPYGTDLDGLQELRATGGQRAVKGLFSCSTSSLRERGGWSTALAASVAEWGDGEQI